jgi:hypothetical protein
MSEKDQERSRGDERTHESFANSKIFHGWCRNCTLPLTGTPATPWKFWGRVGVSSTSKERPVRDLHSKMRGIFSLRDPLNHDVPPKVLVLTTC